MALPLLTPMMVGGGAVLGSLLGAFGKGNDLAAHEAGDLEASPLQHGPAQLMTAPRTVLMQLLGQPLEGRKFLWKNFGMDPESPITRALGTGFEIVTDPLTWLGAGSGFLGSRFAKAPLEKLSALRAAGQGPPGRATNLLLDVLEGGGR